jgi:hypothetical protein
MKNLVARIMFLCLGVLLFSIGLHAQTYNWVKGGGSAASLSAPDKLEGTYKCVPIRTAIYTR